MQANGATLVDGAVHPSASHPLPLKNLPRESASPEPALELRLPRKLGERAKSEAAEAKARRPSPTCAEDHTREAARQVRQLQEAELREAAVGDK